MNPSNKADLSIELAEDNKLNLPSADRQKADWQENTHKTIQAKKRHPLKMQSSQEGKPNAFEVSVESTELLACQLYSATGQTDWDAGVEVMTQVVNVNHCSKDVQKANASLGMLDGIAPETPLEGLLAAQMTTCHNMAMEFSRRATFENQTDQGIDLNLNRATKLMRTFTAQVEALQKLRNKGQQKITVQHVQVGQGGQAIIGDVSHGGGSQG